MKLSKYPDGTSYVNTNSEHKHQTLRVNSYEDLWHLIQYVDSQNSLGYTPRITIPCLIDAQADRRFNKGESSGLKLVCKHLNQLDAKFNIYHPHNPEVVEALMDNAIIMNNHNYVYECLVDILGPDSTSNDVCLMSSDAGGFKPLMKLCDEMRLNVETYSASKSRSYLDGKSKLIQVIDKTDFNGKDIVIVDDISVYGGTFKGLSKLLKERNCGKIYLIVSHMTIQTLGNDPVTNYFDEVYTTNSKFNSYTYTDENYKAATPANLNIIKLFK